MLFSSNIFLFVFLPIVLFLYYIVPRPFKNPVLLLFSLFFYGWGEPVHLILMVITILIDYIFGILIHNRKKKNLSAKFFLVMGIIVNLAILGFFKYAGFFAEQLKLIPIFSEITVPEITLPIGISFYVFQSMSYIIDVYRNDAPVQKDPVKLGTYVTLFPQLIAGPIVRYGDVAQQLESRKENLKDFSSGISLFVFGLAKKVLLANPMGNLWNLLQEENGTAVAWMGICAYTLQIYFDFSGYSDMARGLGRMFGFEFLENFNYPYISKSITEFWRRWHISLSTWFKEYVYIPLGGNRRGLARHIINIIVVWSLTGFWHGASWNFILWGMYYGIILIIEKVFLLKVLKKSPSILCHMYSIIIVMLGWVLFYFEDMSSLGLFFTKLFSIQANSSEGITIMLSYLPILLVGAFAATPVAKNFFQKKKDSFVVRYGQILVSAVFLLLCVAALANQSYNPFIYFRF